MFLLFLLVQTTLPTSGEVDLSLFPQTPELDFVSAADLAAGSEEGVNFLETLSFLEKKIKEDDTLKIDKQSPAAGHLKVRFNKKYISKFFITVSFNSYILNTETNIIIIF